MFREQQNREGKMGKVSEDKPQEKTSNQCLVSAREGNAGRFSSDASGEREAGGIFVSLFPLQGGIGSQTLRSPLQWPHKGCVWPEQVVSELAHFFICLPNICVLSSLNIVTYVRCIGPRSWLAACLQYFYFFIFASQHIIVMNVSWIHVTYAVIFLTTATTRLKWSANVCST